MKKLIFIILLTSTICSAQKFEAEHSEIIQGSIENNYVYLINEGNQIIISVADSGNFEINIMAQADNGVEKLMIIQPDKKKDTLIFENLEWEIIKYETDCPISGQWQFVFIEDSPWYNRLKIDYVEFIKQSSINNKYEIKVIWNQNSESDLAGYKLFYGYKSGDYSVIIDVNLVTEYLLQLSCGYTYFFALKAYDTSENESLFSDEVAFYVECDSNISKYKPIILNIINNGKIN